MTRNRGDILDTSKDLTLRLLYINVSLLVVLVIVDVLTISVNWRFSIIVNPTETIQVTAVSLAIVESVLFLYCGTARNPDTYPVKTRFGDRLCNLLKAVLIFVASCAVIHFVTVLYGAQVFEKYEETFHFSLLLSTLSVVPCLAVIGVKTEAWTRLYFERRPENDAELCLLYLVVCSYSGAWLGAFPIPLDWDRPWQAWPITVCVGALLGHTTGVLLAIGHLWYKVNAESVPPKNR